jgi:hypothetical protein
MQQRACDTSLMSACSACNIRLDHEQGRPEYPQGYHREWGRRSPLEAYPPRGQLLSTDLGVRRHTEGSTCLLGHCQAAVRGGPAFDQGGVGSIIGTFHGGVERRRTGSESHEAIPNRKDACWQALFAPCSQGPQIFAIARKDMRGSDATERMSKVPRKR